MDPEFAQEQEHLDQTYDQLVELRNQLLAQIDVHDSAARQDLLDLSDEVRVDFGGADETIETLAAIETLNFEIDTYNQQHDNAVDKLRRALILLNQPYFAKVRLVMRPGQPPRDVYIGTVGITDDAARPLVIDWRAPVASTYYSQELGPTSFSVDGRVRKVELLLRRQFDISGKVLHSYFDSTVAIQDSLLLSALRKRHSEKLQAITATIQREQNEAIRHADVPVLLVRGIAGSGKTSVMLQRIAYLFYQQRDTLDARDVYLFSPNDVFGRYISAVLPSMGEQNPRVLTWKGFMAELGLTERADGSKAGAETLRTLDELVPQLTLGPDDLREIAVDGRSIVSAKSVANTIAKVSRRERIGRRWSAQVKDALEDKVNRRLATLAHDEDLQDEMLSLGLTEQMAIFGETVAPDDDAEVLRLARTYVEHLYGSAREQVAAGDWLRIDRIGMRLLNKNDLTATEWLYCKLLLIGGGAEGARYVMVDEVQDYTAGQLMVMRRYFPRAHFMLLGDENQAIREGTASFDDIRAVFGGPDAVDECALLTSYRSSPEITALFSRLMPADERVHLSSVREEGAAPDVREVASGDAGEYLAALREVVGLAREQGGLTAIIPAESSRTAWLSRQLGKDVHRVRKDESLPASGVALIDLALAKGLEFDQVIIPDAQEAAYPDTPLARRRLYTAISRGMHRVAILSQGPLTPLLR